MAEIGIEPLPALIAGFDLYSAELKKWNRVHNITSITDDEEIVVKHFLDSLLYLKALPAGECTLCDVGTGGGFPGLPIAMVRPDISVALLEPSIKRVAFLRQMRRSLGLKNVEVVACRAEDLLDSEFDVVVTRATFSIKEMLEKTASLVRPGGMLIMSKGPKYEEELKGLSMEPRPEVIKAELKSAALQRFLIRIKL